MSARSIASARTIGAVVLALACTESRDASNSQTAAASPVVTITSTDYAIEAPDTLSAGFTVFRLLNHGEEPHEANLVRLEGGRTLPEFIKEYGDAVRTVRPRPDWAKRLGGPAAFPHAESNATLYLEPGSYAWVCNVPGPDGVVHVVKHNEARAFVVRERSTDSPQPRAPQPTVSVRLLDYSFQLSAPLTAGKHTVRVENDGIEPHHLLLFKLAPGKTMEDFNAWMQNMQGEPPATVAGTMSTLSTGADAYTEVDLSAGDYVLVCLVAGRDDVPHVAKGMVQQIRID